MGYKIHSVDDGHVPSIEYLPCGAIAPKVGMAMIVEGGQLAVVSGAEAPAYISMCERETACEAGELIPVIRVDGRTVYETTFNAEASAVKLGDKLTISDDGLQATATTGGAAEVITICGTAVGDAVRVRF